jgi:hypothetical protein
MLTAHLHSLSEFTGQVRPKFTEILNVKSIMLSLDEQFYISLDTVSPVLPVMAKKVSLLIMLQYFPYVW